MGWPPLLDLFSRDVGQPIQEMNVFCPQKLELAQTMNPCGIMILHMEDAAASGMVVVTQVFIRQL